MTNRTSTETSSSCKNQMFEEKTPDAVEPADGDTDKGDQNRKEQRQQTLRTQKCGPADKNFHDPVYAGDQKQNDLQQSRLFIEPTNNRTCHEFLLHTVITNPLSLYTISEKSQDAISRRDIRKTNTQTPSQRIRFPPSAWKRSGRCPTRARICTGVTGFPSLVLYKPCSLITRARSTACIVC